MPELKMRTERRTSAPGTKKKIAKKMAKRAPAPVELVSDLAKIADINNAYDLANAAGNTMVQHAVRCGELLSEEKARVGHGGWMKWLRDNFKGSIDTANKWMRLAANSERVLNSDIPMRAALKLIASPKAPKPKAGRDGFQTIRVNFEKGELGPPTRMRLVAIPDADHEPTSTSVDPPGAKPDEIEADGALPIPLMSSRVKEGGLFTEETRRMLREEVDVFAKRVAALTGLQVACEVEATIERARGIARRRLLKEKKEAAAEEAERERLARDAEMYPDDEETA